MDVGRSIKSKLAAMGKTQKDLYIELNRRGANLSTIQQLYQYTNGICTTYKSEVVLQAAMQIVNEWQEKEEL